MRHATLTSRRLKERREKKRHSGVLERQDDSFESSHQTFTLCLSVKCQTDFQSSQQCRENKMGRSSVTIHNAAALKTAGKKTFKGQILQHVVLLRKETHEE